MSAAPPTSRPSRRAASDGYRPTDMEELRMRRRQARRRQRLARVDVGLGLLGALILILATPGLAITALVALIILLACAGSLVVERRKRTHRRKGPRRRRTPRRRSGISAARPPRG